MATYSGECLGRGTPGAACGCICHLFPEQGCDDMSCAPVSAKASDNIRFRHVNRDPDKAKRCTRRGSRSLRRT